MNLSDLKDVMTINELRGLLSLLEAGVPASGKNKEEIIDEIYRVLTLRFAIKERSGELIKVRTRPTYRDGWKYCSNCRVSYMTKKYYKCPLCHLPLRSSTSPRKKKEVIG